MQEAEAPLDWNEVRAQALNCLNATWSLVALSQDANYFSNKTLGQRVDSGYRDGYWDIERVVPVDDADSQQLSDELQRFIEAWSLIPDRICHVILSPTGESSSHDASVDGNDETQESNRPETRKPLPEQRFGVEFQEMSSTPQRGRRKIAERLQNAGPNRVALRKKLVLWARWWAHQRKSASISRRRNC